MSATAPRFWRGVILMTASSFMFALMATLQTISSADSATKALFRFVVGLTLLGTLAIAGRIKLEFHSGWLLYARGAFGGASVFLFFLAMTHLGIGKGTVLTYTYPVFAAILGSIFLKERFGPLAWLAIFGSLAGVWMLASREGDDFASLLHLGKWELLAILGAMCSSVAITIIKLLHNTESSYSIFFSQCALGIWLMLLPANLSPVSLGYGGGMLLVAIGVAAAIGQLLMTEAYRHTTATVGSLMGMLVPVLNLAIGLVFFGETFEPRAAIGTAIIFICTIVVVLDGHGFLRSSGPRPA